MDTIQAFKLTKRFNGLVAVDGIDLKVGQRDLFSLPQASCCSVGAW